MLDSIHGLLRPVFQHFLVLMSSKTVAVKPTAEQSAWAKGILGQHEELVHPEEGQHPLSGQAPGPAADPPSTERTVESSAQLAALNAKDREAAWKWLDNTVGNNLLLLSLTLRPLGRLLNKHFELASEKWEQRERAKVARGLLESKPAERKCRVQIAADGELELSFMEDLHGTFYNTQLWKHFDSGSLTFAFRARCFKLASRMGAVVHQTLFHVHKCYPFRLFKLLTQPHLALRLARERDCLERPLDSEAPGRVPRLGH